MLAIFESHPVQYRAPVYRELQRLVPGLFHVFYATDVSMRGNADVGFGMTVAWDEPLLDGYPHTILKLERRDPLKGFRSLHGNGLANIFNSYRPRAILQTQYLFEYDFAALFHAWVRGIPIWIRQETQDEATNRSRRKELLRSVAYRILYSFVDRGFYIGELNRRHLLRHGIPEHQLARAPYCTPDRFQDLPPDEHIAIRQNCRTKLGIDNNRIVVGFFGKLIPKKNPDLLLQAAALLGSEVRSNTTLLFVGSGPMENQMKEQSRGLEKFGIQCAFAGFVNQSEIRDYYAATDILVLPSRRAGETWGLVVNEGLQAGCSIVLSNATGCHEEFGKWDRVRVIAEEDAPGLARAIADLHRLPLQRNWARELMKYYSVERAAQAIADNIRETIP